jgi:hypothetical protein
MITKNDVLTSFSLIGYNFGKENQESFINDFLSNVKIYCTPTKKDPLVPLFNKLHNSIEKHWKEHSTVQYLEADVLIKKFAQRKSIKNDDLSRALLVLEKLGFE